jgi:eukaryotic-like serine/threonine-protein kinase
MIGAVPNRSVADSRYYKRVRSRRTTISGARAVFVLALIVSFAASVARARASDFLSLDIAWVARLDSPPAAQPAAGPHHVYLALRSGQVVALSLEDGRESWRTDVAPLHGVAAGEDRVFAVADGQVVSLDGRTGEVAWRVDLATAAVAPTWRSGWLIAGTSGGDVVALRASDGVEVWRRSLGAALRHPVSIDGDRAYAALSDGSLAAMDVTTGQVQWHIQLPDLPGPVLALGDRVYVGSDDKFFYALDAADGRRRWRWRTGGDVIGLPALDEHRVYFVSLDNVARALDARSGVQQWRRALDSRPRAGPVLVEGLLIVGGLGAELRMLQAATGTVAGRWMAPGELAQPPLILPARGQAGSPRMVIVTGAATGDWRAYGLRRALEPAPTPLKEIPGRPLPPDDPPVPREPPRPGGPSLP